MAKFLTFSFDDGTKQDFRLTEIFGKYGIKSTFNINSGLFGKMDYLDCDGQRVEHFKINESDVRQLYAGQELAVHTVTHPSLPGLSEEDIVYQVNHDKKALEEIWGQKIIGMAYPCGGINHDERVMEIIKRRTDIRYARTITSTYSFGFPENFLEWNPTCHTTDEKLFELLEEFLKLSDEEDRLFYIWGHAFNFDASNQWDRITDFCREISTIKEIELAVNSEVYFYAEKKAQSVAEA